MESSTSRNFSRLIEIIETLRSEKGCLWDRKQTPASLSTHIINETYELLEAIEDDQPDQVREECGDLFFLLVFTAWIYQEEKKFTIDEALTGVIAKMMGRHPHVFADATIETEEELIRQWQRIKAEEKKDSRTAAAVFASVPRALPALRRAQLISERAAREGFDWPDAAGVWKKMDEEFKELATSMEQENNDAVEEELGDLLFTAVNLARKKGLDAEHSLRLATEKFIRRFQTMEDHIRSEGASMETLDSQTLELYWQQAKKMCRTPSC